MLKLFMANIKVKVLVIFAQATKYVGTCSRSRKYLCYYINIFSIVMSSTIFDFFISC